MYTTFVIPLSFAYLICYTADKEVTISDSLPTLAVVKKRMERNTCESGDLELTKRMKTIIQAYLASEGVYGDVNTRQFLEKASFLDPRYKSRFSPNAEALIRTEASSFSCGNGKNI